MTTHLEIGRNGEKLAKVFLQDKGFTILETNWRYQRSEVDIIALDEEVLVFVEVKTRSSDVFSKPEDFLTKKKERLFSNAAGAYMDLHNYAWEVRFDIISVLLKPHSSPQILHFEDAFFPGIK